MATPQRKRLKVNMQEKSGFSLFSPIPRNGVEGFLRESLAKEGDAGFWPTLACTQGFTPLSLRKSLSSFPGTGPRAGLHLNSEWGTVTIPCLLEVSERQVCSLSTATKTARPQAHAPMSTVQKQNSAARPIFCPPSRPWAPETEKQRNTGICFFP